MTQPSLLFAFCLLGASSAHFLAPRNVIPKSMQVKNYPGQCAVNDQATTKTCLDAYFKAYGIDSSKGLPEYFDYIAKTGSIVELYGVTGFDMYCDFESTLETCLGDLMTSPCMNPVGFTKMYGVNETEALNYATTFPVEAYVCQNKELTKSYFPCMMDIGNDHIEGLVDCTVEMQKEFQYATDICLYICNTQEIAFNFDMNGVCQDKMHQC